MTEVRPLWNYVTVQNGYAFDSQLFSDTGDIPLARIRDILSSEFETFISRETVPSDDYVIQDGDLVIGMDGDFNSVIWERGEAALNQRVCVVRPHENANIRFVHYAMMKPLKTVNDLRYSTTVKHLSQDDIYSMRVPLPDLAGQQRIADYLDRETAEIDAAVADLDRYVDLLEQRRLLTVDEVLYFLKAAASEWPEMSLKFIIKERFVGDWGEETGTADIDAPCVRVADFDRPTNTVGDQVPTIRSYSLDKYEAKRLRHHDILVERSGGGEKTPVGSAMLYTGGDEVLCANFIEVVRLKEDQLPEYWVHVLRREYMGRNTMRFVKQTTGIQNLDPQGFYDQKFPVPSLDRQIKLANELRERTSEIDYLIAEAKKLRDLLLKRRSVLITEVVTGRKQV